MNDQIDATGPATSDAPEATQTTTGNNPPPADHPLSPAPASAPAAHRNFLQNVGHAVETGALDVAHFVAHLPTIMKAWNGLAPQVKAVAAQVLHDVLNLEHLITQDVADGEKGDIAGVIELSEQTWTAIKQLIADARSGEQEIVDSLKVLGITL